ncbi:hypothetical protein NDU88_008633 [Pleurodeles waltl]|uniref:Uncharacterized protein n=1 Tax=Pleurodeles waltl TaxID=8319 RepID=A0AAV7QP68_PLEWA|nr:hypothetical protein NDU88_008633 [Pleurodeles waltl]
MSAEEKVQAALRLLTEAGCLDILKEDVVGPSRPPRRASSGVAVAVLACSPPRAFDGRQAGGKWEGRREVPRRCWGRGCKREQEDLADPSDRPPCSFEDARGWPVRPREQPRALGHPGNKQRERIGPSCAVA